MLSSEDATSQSLLRDIASELRIEIYFDDWVVMEEHDVDGCFSATRVIVWS